MTVLPNVSRLSVVNSEASEPQGQACLGFRNPACTARLLVRQARKRARGSTAAMLRTGPLADEELLSDITLARRLDAAANSPHCAKAGRYTRGAYTCFGGFATVAKRTPIKAHGP